MLKSAQCSFALYEGPACDMLQLRTSQAARHDGYPTAAHTVQNQGGQAMSVFGNIMSAIFGHSSSAQAAPAPSAPGAAPAAKPAAPAGASPSAGASASPAPASTGAASVDVAAVLTNLAAQKKEKLDWRKSIVDLMKLLDLDSSLSARKQLAQELKYSGDMNDSAAMNIWLHKQVMTKLAENGGKVPAELKA
jgi:Domain of unknown function (DUF3597)